MLRRIVAVSCILRNRGRILILKRGKNVETNPRRWSVVSGRVEGGLSCYGTAMKEILEETGLEAKEIHFIRRGRPVAIPRARGTVSVVYPYLFESKTRTVQLNWEHTHYSWIKPSEITKYKMVPQFADLLDNLRLEYKVR